MAESSPVLLRVIVWLGLVWIKLVSGQGDELQSCTGDPALLPNPFNCGQYYQCLHGQMVLRSCPYGLFFNPRYQICDWDYNVDPTGCSNDPETTVQNNNIFPTIKFVRVTGPESIGVDNAPSTAECPEGTVVIDCQCSVPGKCDGTIIADRFCTAYNGVTGNKQQAIATCLTELRTKEFVYDTSGRWERNPTVECPDGYQLFGCLLRNDWSSVRFVHPREFIELNACAADGTCSAGEGCIIQAICRLVYDP